MRPFRHFLAELFSAPLHWRWLDRGPDIYQATFDIPQSPLRYSVLFEYHTRNGEASWDFTFKLLGRAGKGFDITGTGHELSVFATVFDVLKAFVKIRPDDRITFAGKEPSRLKLYKRLIANVRTLLPGYVGGTSSADSFYIAPDFRARPSMFRMNLQKAGLL